MIIFLLVFLTSLLSLIFNNFTTCSACLYLYIHVHVFLFDVYTNGGHDVHVSIHIL